MPEGFAAKNNLPPLSSLSTEEFIERALACVTPNYTARLEADRVRERVNDPNSDPNSGVVERHPLRTAIEIAMNDPSLPVDSDSGQDESRVMVAWPAEDEYRG